MKISPQNSDKGSKPIVDEDLLQQCVQDYFNYMREIKHRVEVCRKIPSEQNRSLTGYKEADIDLLYLQIRKICELIIFWVRCRAQAIHRRIK